MAGFADPCLRTYGLRHTAALFSTVPVARSGQHKEMAPLGQEPAELLYLLRQCRRHRFPPQVWEQ